VNDNIPPPYTPPLIILEKICFQNKERFDTGFKLKTSGRPNCGCCKKKCNFSFSDEKNPNNFENEIL
jgi:hypothetical protein